MNNQSLNAKLDQLTKELQQEMNKTQTLEFKIKSYVREIADLNQVHETKIAFDQAEIDNLKSLNANLETLMYQEDGVKSKAYSELQKASRDKDALAAKLQL